MYFAISHYHSQTDGKRIFIRLSRNPQFIKAIVKWQIFSKTGPFNKPWVNSTKMCQATCDYLSSPPSNRRCIVGGLDWDFRPDFITQSEWRSGNARTPHLNPRRVDKDGIELCAVDNSYKVLKIQYSVLRILSLGQTVVCLSDLHFTDLAKITTLEVASFDAAFSCKDIRTFATIFLARILDSSVVDVCEISAALCPSLFFAP